MTGRLAALVEERADIDKQLSRMRPLVAPTEWAMSSRDAKWRALARELRRQISCLESRRKVVAAEADYVFECEWRPLLEAMFA